MELNKQQLNQPSQDPKTAEQKTKPKEEKQSGKSRLLLNIVILGGLDLIWLLALLFLLTNLPQKGEKISLLRSQNLQAAAISGDQSLISSLSQAQIKADQLQVLYPNEARLLKFVEEIDRLKDKGVISRFSFANDDPVKDKTGYIGIPIVIEFRGTWPQISQTLKSVQNLPFLIRAIDVEISQIPNQGIQRLKFGGILYVAENFGDS